MDKKGSNNFDQKDNISKTKKKQPSKFGNTVKLIFFINFKIFSYIVNIALTVLLIGIITGGIVGGAFALYVSGYIDPVIDDLTDMAGESDLTTIIYYYEYENGIKIPKEMATLHGSENRFWVKYNRMPQNLIFAFLALEDHRFFDHNGVDIRRTGKSALNFFLQFEDKLSGGSTITQQLVKTLTGDDDVRIQRKIQEMLRAMYLEKISSKSQILETYLNTVNLSGGAYGVQAAADMFFNKDVSELNLIECAAIASIVQSPTSMNPIRRPERNKARRDECLKNMLEYGYITEEEFDAAYDKELVINRPENSDSANEAPKSYYVDQIIEDVMDDLMEKYNYTRNMASNRVFSGGLRIYSVMDNYVQYIMESVYKDDRYFPAQSETSIPYQSAMVVLDPHNNDLLGIVGGRGPKVNRGWNRASTSERQPGSAIKPISVYAPALEKGIINYGTPLEDSPSMRLKGKPWPDNYPPSNEGVITLKRAVSVSKNTIAVRVLQMLTPEESFKFLYNELNIHTLVESMVMPTGQIKSDVDIAPLALGGMTYGVTVYDLTAAYSIFANKGIYSKPRSYTVVKDTGGNTILDNQLEQHAVISEENAYIMTTLLSEVVKSGTAKGLQMAAKIDVAGKTGTTNDDCDRWFVGYTPYYICGVWFGYDKPKYLGVDRGTHNPPLMLFHYVMDTIHEKFNLYENPLNFEMPPSVVTAQFCKDSGMAPGPDCNADTGYYARGFEPVDPCELHLPTEEETTEEITTKAPEAPPATEKPKVPAVVEPPAPEVTTEEYIEPKTKEPETESAPEEITEEITEEGTEESTEETQIEPN